MDLARVRHFLAVAENLNFTAAARELFMEQPALSRQIKLLEADLGVTLFERNSRRVTLTEAGEALLPFARKALDACEAGENAARGAVGLDAGSMRLGASPQAMAYLLAPYLRRWRSEHPRVRLELVEGGILDLMAMLEEGSLDVAVVTSPVAPGFEQVPGRPVGLEAVVLPDDPLAAHQQVEVDTLAERAIITLDLGFKTTNLLAEAAGRRRLELDVLYHSTNAETVVALVTAGHGVGVLPNTVDRRRPGIVRVPITEDGTQLEFDLVLAWDPSRAAVDRFEAFARSCSRYLRMSDDPAIHGLDLAPELDGKEPAL